MGPDYVDFTFAFDTTIIRLKLTDIYLYYVAQVFLPPPVPNVHNRGAVPDRVNEPEKIMDTCIYKPLTEEEKKLSEKAEALHFKWWSEERAKERKEKRRQRYQEYKERMAIPLDPLPKTELCPYEQLRENNIKEREEAMRKCGFFRDLENTKKEIGLVKDNME